MYLPWLIMIIYPGRSGLIMIIYPGLIIDYLPYPRVDIGLISGRYRVDIG
jgi:hypothetical protein